MIRSFLAAVLALGGLVSVAPAQIYTGYYHSPPVAYSNYSYTTGYGPWSVFDWRLWAGVPPYGSGYGYAPAYSAGYFPTTAAYAPTLETTVAFAGTSSGFGSACCTPCSPCGSCAGGSCPGGNCGLNYGPVPTDLKPQPDPASSGTSGTRTFRSESDGSEEPPNGSNSSDDSSNPADADPYRRTPPDDGFNPTGRGAGYRPESTIQQKAPTTIDGTAEEAADPATTREPAEATQPLEDLAPEAAPGNAVEPEFQPPTPPAADPGPDPAALLDLDTRITQSPSHLPVRRSLYARFGSPVLARAVVDPATLPPASDLRLVSTK